MSNLSPLSDTAPVEGPRTNLISPRRSALDFQWKDLWEYRNLIWLFVRRDFVSSYKQTILGPLWFVIPPLIQTVVFTVIFGKIAKIQTGDSPQTLFFMSGVLIWTFFASALGKAASTFIGNAGLFEKVYFPRLAVPIAGIFNNMISFGIQFVLFLAIFFFYHEEGKAMTLSPTVCLLPLLLLQLAMLGLGLGCLVSALTTRYRDFAMMLNFGMQLLMYGSCVMYPLSIVPPEWRWAFVINPVVSVIEVFRFAFFGTMTIGLPAILLGWVLTLVFLFLGLIAFRSAESNFIDTV